MTVFFFFFNLTGLGNSQTVKIGLVLSLKIETTRWDWLHWGNDVTMYFRFRHCLCFTSSVTRPSYTFWKKNWINWFGTLCSWCLPSYTYQCSCTALLSRVSSVCSSLPPSLSFEKKKKEMMDLFVWSIICTGACKDVSTILVAIFVLLNDVKKLIKSLMRNTIPQG